MNTPRFSPFPELITPRFKLRPLRMSDENEVFILRTDERVNQFLDRPRAGSMEDVRQFIKRIEDALAKDESIMWVIEENGVFTGTICLWNISWPDSKAEIGYELLPAHHCKGIMQEVLPVVIEYGFKEMDLAVIGGGASAENVRSIALLRKHGFTRDDSRAEPGEEFYVLRRL